MQMIAEPCAGEADQAHTGGYAGDCVDEGAQVSRIGPAECADCVACERVCPG